MTKIVKTARKWPNLQDPVIFGQIQPFLQPSIERFSAQTADLDLWDHHFGRGTAEKRLDLNIYTAWMMVKKLKLLLSELLGHGKVR